MRHRALLVGVGLLLLAVASSNGADALPDDGKGPVRDLAGHVGRPFLQVIRRYGKPSTVTSVRLVAVAPGVKDAIEFQWVYRQPTGGQVTFLIGEDGRVLEAIARGAESKRYRVEPESVAPAEK